MNAVDIPKTAIITLFGIYEFLRMLFGLKNAAQSIQCLIDAVYQDLKSVLCIWTTFLWLARIAHCIKTISVSSFGAYRIMD